MTGKSKLPWRSPSVEAMDKPLQDYLDAIGRPLDAMTNLAASPTNAEISTAFNLLLANLRSAGRMVE